MDLSVHPNYSLINVLRLTINNLNQQRNGKKKKGNVISSLLSNSRCHAQYEDGFLKKGLFTEIHFNVSYNGEYVMLV